jgi:hypothetical protein
MRYIARRSIRNEASLNALTFFNKRAFKRNSSLGFTLSRCDRGDDTRVSVVLTVDCITKADPEGFEPSTAGLGGRCPILTRLRARESVFDFFCGERFSLWGRADSNCRPSVPNARGWTRLPYYPSRNFHGTFNNKKVPRETPTKSVSNEVRPQSVVRGLVSLRRRMLVGQLKSTRFLLGRPASQS